MEKVRSAEQQRKGKVWGEKNEWGKKGKKGRSMRRGQEDTMTTKLKRKADKM